MCDGCDIDRRICSMDPVWPYIHASIYACTFFTLQCSFKKFLSTFAPSPFWRNAVECNFPPTFGMTLSGPVGIEAAASHHAAGGMINNKH